MREIQTNNDITLEWMRERIDESNKQAAKNRNKYPIQEHATRTELWEFIDCTCNDCACKKHLGCDGHWKLKTNVRFDDFMFGLIRMFVDRVRGNERTCSGSDALGVYNQGDRYALLAPDLQDRRFYHGIGNPQTECPPYPAKTD